MSIISVGAFNQGTGLPNEIPEWVLPLQEQVPVSGFNNDSDYISQSSAIYIKDGTGYFTGNGSGVTHIRAPSVHGLLSAANIHVSHVDGLAPVAFSNSYTDLDDKPDLNAMEAAILGAAAGAAAGAITSAISDALGGAPNLNDALNDVWDNLNPFNDGSDPEKPPTNKEEDYRKIISWYNLYDRPLVARQKNGGLVDTGFFGNIYGAGWLVRDTNIFVNSSNNVVFETQNRPHDPILNLNTKDAFFNNSNIKHISMGSQFANNIITLFGNDNNPDSVEVMGWGVGQNTIWHNGRNPNVVHRWRFGTGEYANLSVDSFTHRNTINANVANVRQVFTGNTFGNSLVVLFGSASAIGNVDTTETIGLGAGQNTLWFNSRSPQGVFRFRHGTGEYANLSTAGFTVRNTIQANVANVRQVYTGNTFGNSLVVLFGAESDFGNLDTTETIGFGAGQNTLWFNSRSPQGVFRFRHGTGEYSNISAEAFTHRGNVKAGNVYSEYGVYAQRGVFNGSGDIDPRVGIGLGAPQATLHIASPANTDKAIFGANADNGGDLRLLSRQVSLLGYANVGYNQHGVKMYLGQYDAANTYLLAAENDKGEVDATLLNGNLWLRGTLDADEVRVSTLWADGYRGNGAGLEFIDAGSIHGNLRVVGANVGVSTQDPQERLDVHGVGNVGIRVLSTTAVDAHRVARLDLVRWDGTLGSKEFGADVNTDWRIENNGNLAFVSGETIHGNVARLQVFSNGAVQAGYFIGNGALLTGLGNLALSNVIDASQVVSGTLAGARLPFGVGDGNLRVVNGNVGVSTATPLATLHVNGNVLVSNGCIYANCIQTTNIAATGVIVGNGALLNSIQAQSIVGVLDSARLPFNIGDGTIQVNGGRVWVNYPPIPPGGSPLSTGDSRMTVYGNVGADYFFGSGKHITQVQWDNIEGAPDFGITGGGDDGSGGTSPFDVFKEAGKMVLGGAASMVFGGLSGYATSAAMSGFGAFSARMRGFTRFQA